MKQHNKKGTTVIVPAESRVDELETEVMSNESKTSPVIVRQ